MLFRDWWVWEIYQLFPSDIVGCNPLDGTFVSDDIVTILYSSWIPIPVREGTLKRFTIGGACWGMKLHVVVPKVSSFELCRDGIFQQFC